MRFATAVGLAAATPAFAQPHPDLMKDVNVLHLPGMDKVVVRPNLVYKTAGEKRLVFDLYLPPGAGAKGAPRPPLVVFANGVGDRDDNSLKDWAIYTSWARLTAVSGMAAVLANSRHEQAAEDIADLVRHLRTQAADLRIDPDNLALWACSANVRVAMPYALDSANAFVKAVVLYYGQLDASLIRGDLPVFVGRAGLDNPLFNTSIDAYVAAAVVKNAPVTIVNLPNGHHAFDLVDDNDASRAIVRETLAFMKDNLSAGVQAGRRERAGQVRALALRAAKDWPAAGDAFAAWVETEPGNGFALQSWGEALYNLKRYSEAGQAYAKAGDLGVIPALTWYNAACSYALAGDKEKAIDLLTRAFGTGFLTSRDQVRTDPDLANLRDDPRYAALVAAPPAPERK
jgi:tetratricopeptide (TPR) repeat protein